MSQNPLLRPTTVLLQTRSDTPCCSLTGVTCALSSTFSFNPGWAYSAYLMTVGRCDDHRFFLSVLERCCQHLWVVIKCIGPRAMVWYERGRICIIVAFVRAGRLGMKCYCRYLMVYKRKDMLHEYLVCLCFCNYLVIWLKPERLPGPSLSKLLACVFLCSARGRQRQFRKTAPPLE
jgi:hypothetical protein